MTMMSRRDAAGYLTISISTLDRLIRAGRIPVARLDGRVLVRQEELDHFIQVQTRKRPA